MGQAVSRADGGAGALAQGPTGSSPLRSCFELNFVAQRQRKQGRCHVRLQPAMDCIPCRWTLGERRDAMGHPVEWLTRFVAAIVLGMACISAPAFADKRIALVIGNSAYQNVARLDNPKNDAKLMAETLRGLGFTLIGNGAQIDLDKAAFDDVLQKFGNQLVGAPMSRCSITPVTASRCAAPTTSCR